MGPIHRKFFFFFQNSCEKDTSTFYIQGPKYIIPEIAMYCSGIVPSIKIIINLWNSRFRETKIKLCKEFKNILLKKNF